MRVQQFVGTSFLADCYEGIKDTAKGGTFANSAQFAVNGFCRALYPVVRIYIGEWSGENGKYQLWMDCRI